MERIERKHEKLPKLEYRPSRLSEAELLRKIFLPFVGRTWNCNADEII